VAFPFRYFPPKFGLPWEDKGPFRHWVVDSVTLKLSLADPVNLKIRPPSKEAQFRKADRATCGQQHT
jgi:hypothetical protein